MCVYVPEAETFQVVGHANDPSEQPVPTSYPPTPMHDPSGAPISRSKSPAQLPSPDVLVQTKVMSAVVSVPVPATLFAEA